MAEMPPRSSNGFTTKFLPGLALGLVVGGLAGAFIPSAMDAVSGPKVPAVGVKAVPAGGAKDRDARPVPPTPPEAAPGEAKPAEVKKPEDEKPASPPATEAPGTPPASAPK